VLAHGKQFLFLIRHATFTNETFMVEIIDSLQQYDTKDKFCVTKIKYIMCNVRD
jgi:hypothetical protein